MNDDCQRYLEAPEANAAHLATCAECRALSEALGLDVQAAPVRVDALPLAPWEGASHRAWPLVLLGVVVLAAAALMLFAVAGSSPFLVIGDELGRLRVVRDVARLAGGAVIEAPLTWQIAIGISFVVVNALLFVLLRRAPRGIDA